MTVSQFSEGQQKELPEGPQDLPKDRTADSLVILLHGLGSNGDDLISLAQTWRPMLPGAAFCSPHACEIFDMGMGQMLGQYQWFSMLNRSETVLNAGARIASQTLNRWIDAYMESFGIAPDRTALVGFSQGCMMSLEVALRRSASCAAVLGYSGTLLNADRLSAEMRSKPPTFLIHGQQDDVVAISAMHQSEAKLSQLGVPVVSHVCQNVGHTIDTVGAALGGQFLQTMLATPQVEA